MRRDELHYKQQKERESKVQDYRTGSRDGNLNISQISDVEYSNNRYKGYMKKSGIDNALNSGDSLFMNSHQLLMNSSQRVGLPSISSRNGKLNMSSLEGSVFGRSQVKPIRDQITSTGPNQL